LPGPVGEATVTNDDRSEYLLDAYNALCTSYHAIDDFRTKLLGFLPLVTGGGLVLLTGRVEDVRKDFFGPVGRFGILVTVGLLAYEMFGIKKCHALIEAGKAMEQDMGLPDGQFTRRPNNLLWIVNEPFAAAIIYPAVLAAWTYLALLYPNPSQPADPSRSQWFSLYVLVAGFALILLYDWYLRNQHTSRRGGNAAGHPVRITSRPTANSSPVSRSDAPVVEQARRPDDRR
jgi:hypothetical protein